MGFFHDLTDWIDQISGNWWFLIVIFVIAYLDSVVPVVPSETTVIIGGVAAGQGKQQLLLVILAGAIGAFLGDNTAYTIGDRFSGVVKRRADRSEKTKKRLHWATAQIEKRGGPLLVTARFIPGGRTALTIASGLTHQPRDWFVRWIAIATTVWASYAAILGWYFGDQFDDHTTAFLLALGAALSVTLLIEVVRHFRTKGDHDNNDHDAEIAAD